MTKRGDISSPPTALLVILENIRSHLIMKKARLLSKHNTAFFNWVAMVRQVRSDTSFVRRVYRRSTTTSRIRARQTCLAPEQSEGDHVKDWVFQMMPTPKTVEIS
ncbi:hypothetical protein J6590_048907 [Homalodisca vitripennis]|nr:hypothetical protein J6590_048907 [Homalodisca vitripennis]